MAIPEARVFESRPISDVVEYAVRLREQYGHFRVYADAENAYGNLDLTNAGFEVVPVPFGQRKEEGIENVARFFNHSRVKIADAGDLKVVIRQLLRLHRNDLGKVVKEDDHGPDALMCAMLHFRFEDEFDTALSALLSGTDRERLKVTDRLLEACIRTGEPVAKYGDSSMGISVGSNSFYCVISSGKFPRGGQFIREARFIGRARSFADLQDLMARYRVNDCVMSANPEPHLVQAFARQIWRPYVMAAVYLNDGHSRPQWDRRARQVTVDRTFAMNSAYEEIRNEAWWLPPNALEIDDGEFFAQMKAPTRVRDLSTGELRYRWTESGGLDHYRHAHVFDHLAAYYRQTPNVRIV